MPMYSKYVLIIKTTHILFSAIFKTIEISKQFGLYSLLPFPSICDDEPSKSESPKIDLSVLLPQNALHRVPCYNLYNSDALV